VLAAFRDSIVFFYSPTEVHAKALPAEQRVRVGGLVEEGSLKKIAGGGTVTFRITDLAETIDVTYTGILPDLFREGQGVVAQGRFQNGVLPTRCWPSTTRTTCRPRLPTRSRNPASGSI